MHSLGKVKARKKPTTLEKYRKYRIDKKHPKRTKITIAEDFGKIERTTKYFMETEPQETIIIKKKNPNLITIWKSVLKIVHYKDTERTFVYDLSGNYLGEFEKHDLKGLFNRFGRLLRELKK